MSTVTHKVKMNVPFVDLQGQYQLLRQEVLAAVDNVFSQSSFILGDDVAQFEKEFAAFCGARESVGVATGCDALLWALKACGIGEGDEVITAANSYIATALAITASGARPVLVDCLADSYCLDPAAVRPAITPRTKALIPVHLYGQAADMDALLSLAREFGLDVIEDAAQAHGATFRGKACGTFGRAGCFSFYPGKNLGAYGDGGAVTTDDPKIAQHLRMLRNYGQSKKYYHDITGWNSRLDTVQAAILRIKLRHLAAWNDARRRHAVAYGEQLKSTPLILPKEMPGNRHIYHLYVVHVHGRKRFMEYLSGQGIGCGIHYPVPIHLQAAYRDLGYSSGSMPITERLAPTLVSLPMFPEMTTGQLDYTCERIRAYFGNC